MIILRKIVRACLKNHSRYLYNDAYALYSPLCVIFAPNSVNIAREQLRNGQISEDEYFEWKINWPDTSSNIDHKKCSYQWRRK